MQLDYWFLSFTLSSLIVRFFYLWYKLKNSFRLLIFHLSDRAEATGTEIVTQTSSRCRWVKRYLTLFLGSLRFDKNRRFLWIPKSDESVNVTLLESISGVDLSESSIFGIHVGFWKVSGKRLKLTTFVYCAFEKVVRACRSRGWVSPSWKGSIGLVRLSKDPWLGTSLRIYFTSLSVSTLLLTLNPWPFVKSGRSLRPCHFIIKNIISVRVNSHQLFLACKEALMRFLERIPVVARNSILIVRSSERVKFLNFSKFKLVGTRRMDVFATVYRGQLRFLVIQRAANSVVIRCGRLLWGHLFYLFVRFEQRTPFFRQITFNNHVDTILGSTEQGLLRFKFD